METVYPDISPLLAAKAERRRTLAALSWEEKVAIIERMQQLLPRNAWHEKPVDDVEDSQSHSLTPSRKDAKEKS